MLTIKNFSKSYASFAVLGIQELHLTPGVYWIKGENGSGKTTLFKSIAGILPHQGVLYFDDGIALKDHGVEYRRRVNYSEAEPIFPGFLTAKDLMLFIGKAKGSWPLQHEELIETLGIKSFYTTPCQTYSSGMLKKLSLALAFLGKPRVIILDEPLNTLDAHTRAMLYTLIHKATALEIIVLVSSHQLVDNNSIAIKETFTIANNKLISAP